MKVKFRPKGTYLNMTKKNLQIIKEIQKLTTQSEILGKMMELDSSDHYNLEIIKKMNNTLTRIELMYDLLDDDSMDFVTYIPSESKEKIEYR